MNYTTLDFTKEKTMRVRDERKLIQLMKEMIYVDGDKLIAVKEKIKRIYARYNLI